MFDDSNTKYLGGRSVLDFRVICRAYSIGISPSLPVYMGLGMTNRLKAEVWPEIPFDAWQETCAALHLWCQIVGKYRLKHSYWVNHSWHATLYVTSRGLTTGPIPDPQVPVTVSFDFCDSLLLVEASGGQIAHFRLESMSVAEFRSRFDTAVRDVGGNCDIHFRPNELPDPIPFH
ncbi:MAG: DUF5996 family protein, partial [Cyanobacteria bacterium P01_C01_bin.147]